MLISRLGLANGFLLACYFVPAWGVAALKIARSPIHGLYERANIAPTLFFSDHLPLYAAGITRFAWLLALAKLLVAAFFALFATLVLCSGRRGSQDSDEALAIALALGLLISFASMILAAQVGEAAALRLHATESLVLIGALVLFVIDAPKDSPAPTVAVDAAMSVPATSA